MKYVRVVLAVRDEDLERFEEVLDWYIEADQYEAGFESHIEGAYVSAPYETREEGLNAPFENRPLPA